MAIRNRGIFNLLPGDMQIVIFLNDTLVLYIAAITAATCNLGEHAVSNLLTAYGDN